MNDPRQDRAFQDLERAIAKATRIFAEEANPYWVDTIEFKGGPDGAGDLTIWVAKEGEGGKLLRWNSRAWER